jgi:hypothetical protein
MTRDEIRTIAAEKNDRDALLHALEHGSVCIGIKNGKHVFVSATAIVQGRLRELKDNLGLLERWPVIIDLSGNVVMVEGETHEDAINRYTNRVKK